MNLILLWTDEQDQLPKHHPLAYESQYCDSCKVMIHAFNNETMQFWAETEKGNYCKGCFIQEVLKLE